MLPFPAVAVAVAVADDDGMLARLTRALPGRARIKKGLCAALAVLATTAKGASHFFLNSQ